MAASIRSFIAVHLPDNVREQISLFESRLKRLDSDVKWIRPNNMHITLKFLGDIKQEQIESIANVMFDTAKPIEPFEIIVQGVGAFPNASRPRVLWLGIQSEGKVLENMASELDQMLSRLYFKTDNRVFKPHLTLGRVKSQRKIEEVIQVLFQEGFESRPFCVNHIHLMQSRLKPSGAEYQVLKSIQL